MVQNAHFGSSAEIPALWNPHVRPVFWGGGVDNKITAVLHPQARGLWICRGVAARAISGTAATTSLRKRSTPLIGFFRNATSTLSPFSFQFQQPAGLLPHCSDHRSLWPASS